MKKVIVTGASGFIGLHCLPLLAAQGYEVHAVSARPVGDRSSAELLRWHQCDLLDEAAVEDLFSRVRPSHLLHMAWYAVPQRFWTSLENLRWVGATLSIVQTFASHGGRRVVSAGSCAEYDWAAGLCAENSTPLEPTTLYGACKLSTAIAVNAYCRQVDVSTAWGRIFFLYGPGEHRQKFVASIITSLLNKQPARCSHGEQVRDLLHVQDVARAFVALLDSGVRGSINIASGTPTRLADVAAAIAAKMGRTELLELGALAPRPGEPAAIVATTERLRNELNWAPEVTLDAGLDQTIQWWRS